MQCGTALRGHGMVGQTIGRPRTTAVAVINGATIGKQRTTAVAVINGAAATFATINPTGQAQLYHGTMYDRTMETC